MSDDPELELMELRARCARLEAELEIERARAKTNVQVLEAQLAAERSVRESIEQASADTRRALEESYAAQLQQARDEVELWRRDQRPGLLRWFEARLATIDSTLRTLAAEGELSEAMQVGVAKLRAERELLVEVQARLRE